MIRRTPDRLAVLTLAILLGAGCAWAQELPLDGSTASGRTYRGTVATEGAGAGRVAVARVEVSGLGARALRLALPGDGPLPELRVVERATPGLAGTVEAPGGGAAPTFALERVGVAPAFAVSVASGTRGAYFRKVSGPASTRYRGIALRGRLPRVELDPARWHVPADGEQAYMEGPLDRPSVYVGGNGGGHEIDCGLTWDRVYDERGRATFTDAPAGSDGRDPARRFVVAGADPLVLEDGAGRKVEGEAARALRARARANFAFRVFWRTTNPDEGNTWRQPAVGSKENVYFYPAERIDMRVFSVAANRLRLELGRPGGAGPWFATEVRQVGFGTGAAQRWKRVNSIDQFREVVEGERRLRRGNEGRDVLPTRSRALGAVWDEVVLLGADGSRTPMAGAGFTEVRGGDTAGRYASIFGRSRTTDRGGETLDITPAP
jgi:hypothetical protein